MEIFIINQSTRVATPNRYEKRSAQTKNAIFCHLRRVASNLCLSGRRGHTGPLPGWASATQAESHSPVRKIAFQNGQVAPRQRSSERILVPQELGWELPELLFEQPGETAGVGEAVSSGNRADRCLLVCTGERRARRLQADTAQCRHGRHTAAAAKGELQRTHAAARASRRLRERDRFLCFSMEKVLDPPDIAQTDSPLKRHRSRSRRPPFLFGTSLAHHRVNYRCRLALQAIRKTKRTTQNAIISSGPLAANRAELPEPWCRLCGTDGSQTLRWREMDSNFQFRAPPSVLSQSPRRLL